MNNTEITGYIWTRESNLYDKEKYSIKSQLDACRAAAQADGVEIARAFTVQFSGIDLWKIPELTELRRIMERTPGPKRVYCYAQDRLMRGDEGPEIFWLVYELKRYGADIQIIKDPVDMTSFAGQIMTLFAGHKAAREPKDIKDRTMRGKRKRIQEGKLWGLGRDKYGYRRDKEAGGAEICEAEAETIKRIFRESGSGKGLMTIARDLNHDGVPTSSAIRGERKTQWHPATVRILLRDPAYKGEVYAFRYANGASGTKPAESWHRMPDNLFPAIVDAALWDRAQKRLDTNRGEVARNLKHPALLRGLIFCAKCGERLYYVKHVQKTPNGGKKIRYYYRCASEFLRRAETESGKCGGRSVRAEWIEAQVWAAIAETLDDPDAIPRMFELARDSGDADQMGTRQTFIRKELQKKEAEQQRLAHRLRQADDRVAQLIEADIIAIEDERERLRRDLVEVDRMLLSQEEAKTSAKQIDASELRKSVEGFRFEEKRLALEAYGVTVTANGKDWRLSFTDWVKDEKDKPSLSLPYQSPGPEVVISRVEGFEKLPSDQRAAWRRLAECWVAAITAHGGAKRKDGVSADRMAAD